MTNIILDINYMREEKVFGELIVAINAFCTHRSIVVSINFLGEFLSVLHGHTTIRRY